MNQISWSKLRPSVSKHAFAHEKPRPLHTAIDEKQTAWISLIAPLLAHAVDEALDAVIVCDAQQHILFWNRSAQELYGWSEVPRNIREQPIHTILQSYLENDPTQEASKEITRLLEQDGTWQGELVQTNREGELLFVRSRHVLIRDADGQPTAILQVNRDITERKRVKLQNKEQMRLLFAANKAGFWSFNVKEDSAVLSPVLQHLFALPSTTNLTLEQFLALVHPDDREALRETVQRAIENRDYYTQEFRVIHPEDGSIHWLKGCGYGMYEEQSHEPYVIGVTIDITHQKQIEEELKSTNARITDILESISGGFFFQDTDERIRYVNQEFCKDVGKTPEELLGKNLYDVFPNIRGTDIERYHQLALTTRQPITFESFLSGRWLSVRLSPTSKGMSVHAYEISERKRMEQALQASEAKFRRLVDANIIPIVVASLDGPITEANDAYLELIGYSRDELHSGALNWRALTPPEYEARDNQTVQELKSKGVCSRYEKEYLHKSGRRIPISLSRAMLENSQEEAISFVIDLTAQKEAEKQRAQFLSMISHELRTPLTGIRGSVQLAYRRLQSMFDQDHSIPAPIEEKWQSTKDMLLNAVRQTSILDRLIRDLIEGASIANGQFTLAPQPCDVLQIVQETVEGLRFAIPDRPLLLDVEASERIPIVADADRIGQVLTNYTMNAIKYSPPGEPVVIGVTTEPHDIRVWVRDRGPGLSPEAQRHVWERFYRQPGATDYTGRGVNFGLGLFICQTIITSHHGQVGVESRPGEGATFWFTLPLEETSHHHP